MADPVIDIIMEGGHFEKSATNHCYACKEKWPCESMRRARAERGPIKWDKPKVSTVDPLYPPKPFRV